MMAMPQTIDAIYAFVTADPEDGHEGIPAVGPVMIGGVPMMIPLVGADRERVESYRSQAEAMAGQFTHKITLVRFSHREELEVIEGAKPN